MEIRQIVAAENGWRALFEEPTGEVTRSRVVCWALVGAAKSVEVVGLIVDPTEPTQMIAARDASSPDGGLFTRYAFAPDA